MISTKLYFDARKPLSDGTAPIKISIYTGDLRTFLLTGVYVKPNQWNGFNICCHPQAKELNQLLKSRKLSTDIALVKLHNKGLLPGMTTAELRRRLYENDTEEREPPFLPYYDKLAERQSPGYRRSLKCTRGRMLAFDPDLPDKTFSEIDIEWMQGFEDFLGATSHSRNGRNVHFRNIRTAFNAARKDELTSSYPFRKFKIKAEPTMKRHLSLAQMHEMCTMKVQPWQEEYRDMFVLSFYLRGCNFADLFALKQESLTGDRIVYIRQKTHKPYSVKVEPEAMEIINRWRGKEHLLSVADRYRDPQCYLKRLAKNLRELGPMELGPRGEHIYHGIFPKGITSYWARHTWSQICKELGYTLGFSKDIVSEGLGHSFGVKVTDFYLQYDEKPVDKANRAIIDAVLNYEEEDCPLLR